MSELISRLAEVCREHLLTEKILVVPSLAIGHQIADAVAQSGTPWVNLRVETMRTLADAIAGFELAREGVTVLSRAQALAIIEYACDRTLGADSYFSALLGRPGLYRAIKRSIDDLRFAGIRPGSLPEGAFEDHRKAVDLARVVATYEQELADRKFIDRYGVLARAIDMLKKGAYKPWAHDAIWMTVDELELTSEEERFLNLVSGGQCEKLESGAATATPKQAVLTRAVGEENELRGGFRSILRQSLPFDDAEIIYTTQDPYLPLAYELTAEYGIPSTFAEGVATPFTRPGQACLGFLQWVGGGWDAIHLQGIARGGSMKIPDDSLSAFAFARVLRKAAIGWGRDRYVPRLQTFIKATDSELEDIESEARRDALLRMINHSRATLSVVETILSITDGVADGEDVDTAALARATHSFLDSHAATRNEIDGMALAALRRMLAELAQLPEARVPRPEAVARLADAVRALHVAASNPRPGHLHVAPIRAAGWSGRSNLYLVGLDDAKHPGRGLQDPIVLDAERSAINDIIDPRRLRLLSDAPARASDQFHRLLGRAPDAHWTFSYSSLDLRDRRSRFPSIDLLDVFRATVGNDGASYDDLVAQTIPAGFLESDAPLSSVEWWLAQRFLNHRDDLRNELLQSHPWLSAGATAETARESDQITEWDGRVKVDSSDIDPRLTGRIYSASQIEKMATCPFGWFLRSVLRIDPLDDLVRVSDQWLNHRQFGLLVHEILKTTMDEICATGVKPALARHQTRMQAISEEALAKWRVDVPPATEAAYARQRDEVLAVCEIFLRTEERICAEITPKYFEVAFGTDDADESPIGIVDPVTIPLGRGAVLRLRGRIDRVDQNDASGEWQVWDYKTSSLYDYRERWRLKQGTKLQHAIYARALSAMLEAHDVDGKVDCAGYYFPTAKGGGERVIRACDEGELEEALNLLFDVVGSGWFPVPPAGECHFCDFEPICAWREGADVRMARKLETNAEDPAVRAWRRLQKVE
jgi:RecB family exonuclease